VLVVVMLEEISPKHQLVTTRESCFVIDQMNLDFKGDQRELDLNHSIQELLQLSQLGGIQP